MENVAWIAGLIWALCGAAAAFALTASRDCGG